MNGGCSLVARAVYVETFEESLRDSMLGVDGPQLRAMVRPDGRCRLGRGTFGAQRSCAPYVWPRTLVQLAEVLSFVYVILDYLYRYLNLPK